jgi:hypothetical protein
MDKGTVYSSSIPLNEQLYEWYKNVSESDGIPMSALMTIALKHYII